MYSNNIVNFQVSTTILNASTKKVWKPIEGTSYVHIYIFCTNTYQGIFLAHGSIAYE